MADSPSKEKPNLKICIDNTESDSENEARLVLTDCSDLDDDLKLQEVENEKVEFNVRIGKIQPSLASTTTSGTTFSESHSKTSASASRLKPSSKRYENKAGEFITGLDITEKELREKRKERAKRFGLPEKRHDSKVHCEELYSSLGVKDDQHDERGVRPEAVHVRGLDDMNTQDVFKYFQEFGPGSIEWIDDTSCNVVWLDRLSAARALMKLSRSQASVEKYLKKDKPSDKNKKAEKEPEKPSATSKSESEESEDDDELDLTEDPVPKEEKKTEETPMDISETEDKDSKESVKTETETKEEEMEEGEISDASEVDSDEFEAYTEVNLSRVIWPPGEWRLGVPCPKAKYIFFRFATKADIKLPGAERRSKYYVRHGNPNYGGMKGLISKSRKRQHWSRRKDSDEVVTEEAKFDVKVPRGREIPDYSDVGMFTGDVTIGEREGFDRKPARPLPTAYGSEGEEEEEEVDYTDEEGVGTDTGLSRVGHDTEALEEADSEDEQDSRAAEIELQKLLAVPQRSGRMYADDVEEEIKAKVAKRSDDPNDLTVIADIRERLQERRRENNPSPVDSVLDARQLITGKGLDLRKRLQSKRQKHVHKPDDTDRSSYHGLRIKVVD